MFTKTSVFFFAVFSFVFAASAFADLNMQDGKWEVTTKVEMPGMPAMPPTKFTQCITRKDAVPHSPDKNQDCKLIDTKVSGNTVTWSVHCKSKDGTVDGNGSITYKNNAFDGVVNMTMNGRDTGDMKMTQKMSGKRIGDCK